MLVKDVMTVNILCVAPSVSMREMLQQMVDRALSCALVIDGAQVLGIVTERDLVRAFSLCIADRMDTSLNVVQIMTADPVCISENEGYENALILSRTRKLRHLPVLDSASQLVGLVTQAELLNQHVKLIDQQAKLMDRQVELENNVARLTSLSLEDPLLEIGNRRAMEVDLAHTLSESQRYNKVYSIALFDIDYFKRYNDSYGHPAGDKALFDVASEIKKAIRSSDRVYRYGGEEILVLMPDTGIDVAMLGAERIRQAVANMQIPHETSPKNVLTVSAGVADSAGEKDQDIVSLADKALYAAKDSGRNCLIAAGRDILES